MKSSRNQFRILSEWQMKSRVSRRMTVFVNALYWALHTLEALKCMSQPRRRMSLCHIALFTALPAKSKSSIFEHHRNYLPGSMPE